MTAAHVPLLKVPGWTQNTLGVTDLGTKSRTDGLIFAVCLINSELSNRKIKQNKSSKSLVKIQDKRLVSAC